MSYPTLRAWLVVCALAVAATSCGNGYEQSQQAVVVAETMESVFAGSEYRVVAASAPCPDSSDFRLTILASFVMPGAPDDPVGAVAAYWDRRADLATRTTRSRWTESEMTDSIVTFTESLDGLSGELLAYETLCSSGSIDRDTRVVTP